MGLQDQLNSMLTILNGKDLFLIFFHLKIFHKSSNFMYFQIRYVGDMLAYLHQATPTEKENLVALLKHCQPIEAKNTNPAASQEEKPIFKDKVQVYEEALASITEGACRPLRSRVEQILLSEHGPLILYHLTNLIRFYCGTISHVIPRGSELITMLEDLDQLAYAQFLSILQTSVQHQTSSR